MQGVCNWAENLNKTFEGHNFYKSRADPQICSRVYSDEFSLTFTQTDNILGISSTVEGENLAKSQLGASYEIKDMKEAKFILGICIDRDSITGDITLSQRSYCKCMLKCFNMESCSLKSTPLPPGLVLTAENCSSTPEKTNKIQDIPYQEALGLLMQLQVATWSDISHAITLLSHFAHNPEKSHWTAVKHVLAYIKGILYYEITYKADSKLNPTGYVDSNFVGCKDIHCSTEENIFIMAGGPVSWKSKRQETVALSMVEAKYMGFSRVTTQALWISKYLNEIRLPISKPIVIFADNNRSISHSLNDKNHCRIKHIDMWHHFIKNHVKSGDVVFQYIPTSDNITDLFTKPLSQDKI